MSINPARIVPAGLRCIRQNNGLEQQQIAAQLGVTNGIVLRWEKGRVNPRTHHMLAYARLLDRRLMVGRNRRGLYDLELLLPMLAAFRRAHRLSQQKLADRMLVNATGVSRAELKGAAGEPIGWDLIVRYMAGLGYEIGIARLDIATPQQRREAIAC
jgi:transcriptional regulator with XRE-family HTH domain